MPGTGKTTFLAALWQVVESEEVPGSLVVSEVSGIRDHLNRIREAWLNCQEQERTIIPAEKVVSFRLRNPETGQVVELSLPDLSGETFKLQWETRQMAPEFHQLASGCSGALLFVHPHTVQEPVRIDATIDSLAAAIEEVPAGGVDAGSQPERLGQLPAQLPGQQLSTADQVEPWSALHAPTQVKIVEILQFLLAGPFVNRRLPIALIVSAWDLISGGQAPLRWIKERLPLLYQFLCANEESIPFENLWNKRTRR